jgi:hypothetical protein
VIKVGSYKDLIPRIKKDFKRVKKLKNLIEIIFCLVMPDLLVFIEDMHWPAAPAVLEILFTFLTEIVPHVQDVLSSHDDKLEVVYPTPF